MSNSVSCSLKDAIEPRDPPVALTQATDRPLTQFLRLHSAVGGQRRADHRYGVCAGSIPAARGYLVAGAGGLAHIGSIPAAQGRRRAQDVVNAPLGSIPLRGAHGSRC